MTKQEFTERTGFTPSNKCYELVIEPAYMDSELTKTEWLEEWMKHKTANIIKCYEFELQTKERARRQAEWTKKGADNETKERLNVLLDILDY